MGLIRLILPGTEFKSWVTTGEYRKTHKSHQSETEYLCICKCGQQRWILGSDLRNSNKGMMCNHCNGQRRYKGYNDLSSTFYSHIKKRAKSKNLEVNIMKNIYSQNEFINYCKLIASNFQGESL